MATGLVNGARALHWPTRSHRTPRRSIRQNPRSTTKSPRSKVSQVRACRGEYLVNPAVEYEGVIIYSVHRQNYLKVPPTI